MNLDFLSIILSLTTGIIGAVIASFGVTRYTRKSLEFNSLLSTFDLLGKENHREARKKVIETFRNFVSKDPLDIDHFEKIREQVEIVLEDFDQIGILIYKKIKASHLGEKNQDKWVFNLRTGYIPKEVFFERWASPVIDSWISLEYYIKYHRKQGEYPEPQFMLFFEQLFDDAEKFHKNHQEKNELQELRDLHKKKLEEWSTPKIDPKNDSQK